MPNDVDMNNIFKLLTINMLKSVGTSTWITEERIIVRLQWDRWAVHKGDYNFIALYKNRQEIATKKPTSQLKPNETSHMIHQYLQQFPITQWYNNHVKLVFITSKLNEAHHSCGLT